ncbi:CBS domain-containing protein [Hahella sp. KA22]|uniref:CBS domain-containing protein n=1 Tax=Hahella sp. KA22 TaxID=1628392 RepID=UPI000FDE4A28|nr:CBS domain-containing protein [Hahella sp. KA22]AZZ91373.1 CBS domain-containing protein [Hahella sp. KA22]QAY54743.1 CBS domain-containing protein [Hahella sp. KA22]
MPIYLVDAGHRIITPLSVDPRVKSVEELKSISAIHPIGPQDQGMREDFPYSGSEQDSAPEGDISRLSAQDVMSSPVLYGKQDWSLDEGLSFLREHKVRHLPVRDDQEVVGFLIERELLQAKLEQPEATLAALCAPYLMVGDDADLRRISLVLVERDLDGALVRNVQGDVIGVLTATDILKAIAHFEVEAWA